MKRYLIKVTGNNDNSIYEDEKAVTVLIFVTAENKYRAVYKAAIEVEYRKKYNEYEGAVWEIEKISKNRYIASSLIKPTFHMEFLPVEESVEIISITEQE